MNRSRKSETDSKQTELDFSPLADGEPPPRDQKPPAEAPSIPANRSVKEALKSAPTAPQNKSADPPYTIPDNLGIAAIKYWLEDWLSSNKKTES